MSFERSWDTRRNGPGGVEGHDPPSAPGAQLVGGGMRQIGILAAAGIYALDHHVERLAEDHANAVRLAARLSELPQVTIDPDSVETNMVFAGFPEGAAALPLDASQGSWNPHQSGVAAYPSCNASRLPRR